MAPRVASVFARTVGAQRTSAQTPRQKSGLLEKLSRALGPECARQELRWMRESLDDRDKPCIDREQHEAMADMVDRRLKGEPLQYILGTQPFGPLSLLVRPPTLIPRPETEEWTLRLASLMRKKMFAEMSSGNRNSINVLDLCTGTGCIALLLCHLLPKGRVRATGIDISASAVKLAHENSVRVGMDLKPMANGAGVDSNHSHSNGFVPVQADILDPNFADIMSSYSAPFDIITANPPYIPLHEYEQLSMSVRGYEDRRALLGNVHIESRNLPAGCRERGLVFYHAIAEIVRESRRAGRSILNSGGHIALEVGHDQAQEVRGILRQNAGMAFTEIWKDFAGIERVVVAWS